MTCSVCSHCQAPLTEEESAFREGYSYHKHCHKCYVCSETDLTNAEVFQGVIFCAGCSLRIFKGCSAVKTLRMKQKARKLPLRGKRRTSRDRKFGDRRKLRKNETKVIELARRAGSTPSDSVSDDGDHRKSSHTVVLHTQLIDQKEIREIKSPKFESKQNEGHCHAPLSLNEIKSPKKTLITKDCDKSQIHLSDLRVAELGASTEIATMALRKQSENTSIGKSKSERTVITKSKRQSPVVDQTTGSVTEKDTDSEWLTEEDEEETTDSSISFTGCILDRNFRSIVKIPLLYFKRNIIDKSSLITDVESRDSTSLHSLHKLKSYFGRDAEVDQQRRGVTRLYSTINRTTKPYEMGWLEVKHQLNTSRLSRQKEIKCKHFNQSYSYRCMREQAMKLAGPTESELRLLRSKIVSFFPKLMKLILGIDRRELSTNTDSCSSGATAASPHKLVSIKSI